MEAYHFRWYTFLLALHLIVVAEARLRDGCINLSILFLLLWHGDSCWLQNDIIIDSIFLENCNNAKDVLLLALSPEFKAVFGTFARYKQPKLVHFQRLFSFKSQCGAILCNIACGWVPLFFSAVTIAIAIVTWKFHYHLHWKKASFRMGNI